MPKCPKSPTGAHYFICDPNPGATSKGVCKYCDARDEFLNSWTAEAVALHGEEEDMALTADQKAERHQYYEENRELILECYEEAGGSISQAAKLCTLRLGQPMPPTSLNDLIKKRWKIPKPRKKKRGRRVEVESTTVEEHEEHREQGLDLIFPYPEREVAPVLRGKVTSMQAIGKKITATLEVPAGDMEQLHMGGIIFFYEKQP
jgi:hypothetical protein